MTEVMASHPDPGEAARMDTPRIDTTPSTALEPTTTVNDVLRLVPEASGLLLERGIDTCCGGSATLAEACDDADLDVAALLDELRALPREHA
ncbi:MAG: DUF542 domain-containing protein [Trueperaceae bacterium]|nr:DUF542 domain-containing protein [Trueperaceae bacterium]